MLQKSVIKNVNFVLVLIGCYLVLEARISPDCYGETDVIYATKISDKKRELRPFLTGFYRVLEARISLNVYGENDSILCQRKRE